MNVDLLMNDLIKRTPGENEYHQAVREVLESIEEVYNDNPQFETAHIIERLIDPDRVLIFKIPWEDDQGKINGTSGCDKYGVIQPGNNALLPVIYALIMETYWT